MHKTARIAAISGRQPTPMRPPGETILVRPQIHPILLFQVGEPWGHV